VDRGQQEGRGWGGGQREELDMWQRWRRRWVGQREGDGEGWEQWRREERCWLRRDGG